MKYLTIIALVLSLLIWSRPVVAQDATTKRRPDKTEFVTETQVRLTTESLTVAEVTTATPPAAPKQSLWDFVVQSWQEFIMTIASLFK